MANSYQNQNTVTSRATFQQEVVPRTNPITYTNADPAVVLCLAHAPDGVVTTYTYGTDANLTREGTGQYACEVLLNKVGLWALKWKGSGGGVAGQGENTVWCAATINT